MSPHRAPSVCQALFHVPGHRAPSDLPSGTACPAMWLYVCLRGRLASRSTSQHAHLSPGKGVPFLGSSSPPGSVSPRYLAPGPSSWVLDSRGREGGPCSWWPRRVPRRRLWPSPSGSRPNRQRSSSVRPGTPCLRAQVGRRPRPRLSHVSDTHRPALDAAHPGSPGGTHSRWGPLPPPLRREGV